MNKPKVINNGGIVEFRNSNPKLETNNLIKFQEREYDHKLEKKISVRKAIPDARADAALDKLVMNDEAYRLSSCISDDTIHALANNRVVIRDEGVPSLQINEYMRFKLYGPKGQVTHITEELNTGFKFDIDILKRYAATKGVDIEKDVKNLFGMAKSYWNLKYSGNSNQTVLDKLASDIKKASDAMDEIRSGFWSFICNRMDTYYEEYSFGYPNLLHDTYKNIVFFNDPWIVFSTGFSVVSFANNKSDRVVFFNLSSLLDAKIRPHWASPTSEFYVSVGTFFEVDSKFLGGYRFTRPDGKTF